MDSQVNVLTAQADQHLFVYPELVLVVLLIIGRVQYARQLTVITVAAVQVIYNVIQLKT